MQSHVQDGQYFISYMIELMLELLWTEDDTNEDTRYKVFLPVETPLQLQPPQVIDGESYYLGTRATFLHKLQPAFISSCLTYSHCSQGDDV